MINSVFDNSNISSQLLKSQNSKKEQNNLKISQKSSFLVNVLYVASISSALAALKYFTVNRSTFNPPVHEAFEHPTQIVSGNSSNTPIVLPISINNNNLNLTVIKNGSYANQLSDQIRQKIDCFGANFNLLKEGISQGVSPDILNGCGQAPLHLAAQLCDPSLIDFLLKQKADPNLLNVIGKSPIYIASYQSPREDCTQEKIAQMIMTLISHGADTSFNYDNKTIFQNLASLEEVKLVLCKSEIDKNIKEKFC